MEGSSKKTVAFVCLHCWILLFRFVAMSSTGSIPTIIYEMKNPSSLSPGVPKRLLDPGWESVRSALACAQKSLRYFSNSRGFLYNKDTGKCTPLLWLEGHNAPGAKWLQASEGDIFLDRSISCPGDFQLHGFDSDKSLACILKSTEEYNFADARAFCESWGGYLVTIRTTKKMELVHTVANGRDQWVGLDDIQQEGKYVYHDNGEVMSDSQVLQLFEVGEPNNKYGDQHCIRFDVSDHSLDDRHCYDYVLEYCLCELGLPS